MLFPLLNPSDPALRPLLEGIQGNILKGHGRHHTANLFIRCHQPPADADLPDDWLNSRRDAAKTWLNSLVHPEHGIVRSACTQLQSNWLWKEADIDAGLFAAIHISADGYDYLFGDRARNKFKDDAFRDGMKKRQGILNDPPADEWEAGFREDSHFMLLLAHTGPEALEAATAAVLQTIRPFAGVATTERGQVLLNANGQRIEQFGYVDGISRPLFFEADWQTYKADNNLPTDAEGPGDLRIKFDPRADTAVALLPDPFGGNDPNALGSYFVFRKLEQNVRKFKEAEQGLADHLGRLSQTVPDRKRAGALLIGRFEDGTPVEISGHDGLPNAAVLNNFNYEPANGRRCPYHAHIRKANPRSDLETSQERRERVIVRRGIPYGHRIDNPTDGLIDNKPEDGVGLLFMCYQASIGKRFEFVQKTWVNGPNFPYAASGTDPVIGQGKPTPGSFAPVWDGQMEKVDDYGVGPFVTLKGGAYFFAPSMQFLKSL